jgi:hypothetical protein
MLKETNESGFHNQAKDLPIPWALANKYGFPPKDYNGYTRAICAHDYHPMGILYFSLDDYQGHFMAVTGGLWANGYRMIIESMD